MAVDTLTDEQRAMLDLEAKWWATAAGKDEAIRALGMRHVRYYQQLNQLLDSKAALAHSPVVVNRLRRISRRRRALLANG